MASGKQRNAQRRAARASKARRRARANEPPPPPRPADAVKVNRDALARFNSYGPPDWYQRGYYVDTPFTCVDCGAAEVWTATQQKWWYEVAKGQPFSHAKRCRACRQTRRAAKGLAPRRPAR